MNLMRFARGIFDVPAGLQRGVLGAPPTNDNGVALDRQVQLLLALEKLVPATAPEDADVEQMRAESRRAAKLIELAPRRGLTVSDQRVAGMKARVYRPDHAEPTAPALIYYHGGGFVVCDLDTHDGPCRMLARGSGCVVISVDYRLAPEAVYPAAAEDAFAAFQWVVENAASLGVDAGRIALGGDSAGGNLSAVASIMARDAGGPTPALQVLIYPGVDMTRSMPSQVLYNEGFYLTGDMIDWFLGNYLSKPEQAHQWQASPLFLPDCAGLPPAHVITAGFDPLRDEGDAYAKRLADAGVPVDHRCEQSLVHGFMNMGGASNGCRRAVARIASDLRRAFAK